MSASNMCQYTDTEPAFAWFGNTPLLLLDTASKPLSLVQRAAAEQDSPQTGLSTPKGSAQLGSWQILYMPLSIIRTKL